MSSGQVFERVYREIKDQLALGRWLPGARIEPADVASTLYASITPVRDALHRLTGELLVETPSYNGFRIALPSEAALRDLYSWNGKLLGLALRALPRAGPNMHAVTITEAAGTQANSAAKLFLALARATGSEEHIRAVAALNDRLAPFRVAEAHILEQLAEETDDIAATLGADDRKKLRRAIDHYHRRRIKMTPEILAWRQSPGK